MKRTLTALFCSLALALPMSITPVTADAETTAAVDFVNTPEWSRFMDASALSARINADPDVQVIDIRSKKYLKHGVIPGAVWMPFKSWRGPKERPGQPPKRAELETMLGEAGIDLSKPIIVHNHSSHTIQTGRAAIVYWILKSAGAEQLALLDGGYKAWKAADFPISETHSTLAPRLVTVTYRYDWWADPMDILAISTNQKKGAIIDSRLDAQVRKSVETGKPLMSMPLAQYTPASLFINYLSAKKMATPAKQEFRKELEDRGVVLGDGLLISVCQTGELSALSWFYASEIVGIDNVRFYPDALQGWASDGGFMFGLRTSL